jgi:hypothetical protein
MGAKILLIFEKVEQELGLEGRMKLAEISKITKKEAATIEDSADKINKLKKIASELLKRNIE